MTPRSLLRETAKRFRDAGIPDPETDSALLLSFLTGLEPLRLRLDTDTELPPGILRNYDALVGRRLVLSRGYWYAEDLGSTNGTRVNGFRTQDHRVDPDSRVSFGKHEFILRYDPVKNGAQGEIPPDYLDNDVFQKSLLERAGVAKQVKSMPKTWEIQRQRGATLEELESGEGVDYSNLTIDDIEFD